MSDKRKKRKQAKVTPKVTPNVTLTRDHRRACGVPSDAAVIARIYQNDAYARWAFDLGWASEYRTAAAQWGTRTTALGAAKRMIRCGRLELLRWAIRHGGLRCDMGNLRGTAAKEGSVAALRILCNRTHYLCWARQSLHLAPIAAEFGRIAVLKFLYLQNAIDPKTSMTTLKRCAAKAPNKLEVYTCLDDGIIP